MSWAKIVENFDRKITPLTEPTPMLARHKRCKECEKVLPRDEFYSRDGGNRTTSRCKACYIVYQKGLNAKTKAKRKALYEAQQEIPTKTYSA